VLGGPPAVDHNIGSVHNVLIHFATIGHIDANCVAVFYVHTGSQRHYDSTGRQRAKRLPHQPDSLIYRQ
jgi:hypothetical protein